MRLCTRGTHTWHTHVAHTRGTHTWHTHVSHTHVLHTRATHTCYTHVLHTRTRAGPHNDDDLRGTEDPRVAYDKSTGTYYMFYTCWAKNGTGTLCA